MNKIHNGTNHIFTDNSSNDTITLSAGIGQSLQIKGPINIVDYGDQEADVKVNGTSISGVASGNIVQDLPGEQVEFIIENSSTEENSHAALRVKTHSSNIGYSKLLLEAEQGNTYEIRSSPHDSNGGASTGHANHLYNGKEIFNIYSNDFMVLKNDVIDIKANYLDLLKYDPDTSGDLTFQVMNYSSEDNNNAIIRIESTGTNNKCVLQLDHAEGRNYEIVNTRSATVHKCNGDDVITIDGDQKITFYSNEIGVDGHKPGEDVKLYVGNSSGDDNSRAILLLDNKGENTESILQLNSDYGSLYEIISSGNGTAAHKYNNNVVCNIDSNGCMIRPNLKYFRAKLTGDLSNVLGNDVEYQCVFDQIVTDTYNQYSSSTGIWTVPNDGFYSICGTVSLYGLNTSVVINAIHSEDYYDNIWQSNANISDPDDHALIISFGFTHQLTSGDEIYIQIKVKSGTQTASIRENSFFSAYMI